MTKRQRERQSNDSVHPPRRFPFGILIAFISSVLVSGLLWLTPIEVAKRWAYDQAGSEEFAQFEAIGKAVFAFWLARFAITILPVVIWCFWSDVDGWLRWIAAVCNGLLTITKSMSRTNSPGTDSYSGRVRRWACQGLLVAWMVLFAVHAVHGIGQRIQEWPYFQFNSAAVMLPNISDSNCDVIRYIQEATPPNSHILVASDQKLFFLSYYLRPRTLFHRMHPDSEHVIPLKDQLRVLKAYRLDELSPSDLKQMPHDFTLEYFEHPEMVNRSEILDDREWIAFIQKRKDNSSFVPDYVVRLRRTRETPP